MDSSTKDHVQSNKERYQIEREPMGKCFPGLLSSKDGRGKTAIPVVVERGNPMSISMPDLVPRDGSSAYMETGSQIFSAIPSCMEAAFFLASCYTGNREEQFLRENQHEIARNDRALSLVSGRQYKDLLTTLDGLNMPKGCHRRRMELRDLSNCLIER